MGVGCSLFLFSLLVSVFRVLKSYYPGRNEGAKRVSIVYTLLFIKGSLGFCNLHISYMESVGNEKWIAHFWKLVYVIQVQPDMDDIQPDMS